jgi:hypothetical protein
MIARLAPPIRASGISIVFSVHAFTVSVPLIFLFLRFIRRYVTLLTTELIRQVLRAAVLFITIRY